MSNPDTRTRFKNELWYKGYEISEDLLDVFITIRDFCDHVTEDGENNTQIITIKSMKVGIEEYELEQENVKRNEAAEEQPLTTSFDDDDLDDDEEDI